MAILARDTDRTAAAIEALLSTHESERVQRVAEDLLAWDEPAYAAMLFERLERPARAAEAWADAGRTMDAARCYDLAGQPAAAARLLEAAIRDASTVDPPPLRVRLGTLYAKHRRHEAAVRVLQAVGPGSPQRREALAPLWRSLEALGLQEALLELRPELIEAGLDPETLELDGRSPEAGPAEALLFGRFRVLEEVARTPHARLLRAEDVVSGDTVAVKLLAATHRGTGRDALARFAREAEALRRLRNPHVVRLRSYHPEGPAIVLDWMEGGSLASLLERESLAPRRAVSIALGILGALGDAHRLGVLHRDLKPSNLLFDRAGAVKVADFGAAHLTNVDSTVTVGDIGTLAYMAPEQRAGRAASIQSDLYSVGVILHEMLTRQTPERLRPEAIDLGSYHPDLESNHDAFIRRALESDPERRFESARAMGRALEALAWSSRVVAQTPSRSRGTVARPHESGDQRVSEDELPDGLLLDRWLNRTVRSVALDEIALLRAMVRTRSSVFPTVYRIERKRGRAWVEVVGGRPVAQGIRLAVRHVETLRDALVALHAEGVVFGAVDALHVTLDQEMGVVRLRWPTEKRTPPATPEEELSALERLANLST